ncbi:hypothetical protein GIB67_007958 [Kingdonia uniflora]|uniref:Uncharacterized protein n=1 Tax=Kingdonia uniflora TaxID=39325 RepID=A0A7J7LTM3_9MAGN|nr:hypothetical protein GIB67_007958 [Kingdonia uniflora]
MCDIKQLEGSNWVQRKLAAQCGLGKFSTEKPQVPQLPYSHAETITCSFNAHIQETQAITCRHARIISIL